MLQIVETCDQRVFGLTPAERLKRQRGDAPGPTLIAHASAVLSDAAVEWLLENPGTALATPANRPVAVALDAPASADPAVVLRNAAEASVNPAQLPKMFIRKLRRRDNLLVRSLGEQPRGKVERDLFDSVYKGVTDLVTKYAWPLPALWATRLCAAVGVPPNAVTIFGMAVMAIAAFLWTQGHVVAGLACAWLMTFLDTVDGKLARVTVTSSEIGNKLDHVTDIVHPPIWWVCLAVGLNAGQPLEVTRALELSCLIILITYVVGRVMEALFKRRIGYNPFLWRPFDSAFRLVVSRRNIILLIMTAGVLAGSATWAFHLCALWSIISVGIQVTRYVQASRAARRGDVQSWLM